ncbi:hypothetical protein QR680_000534 [Steinernema hermaphroditum]|uniref:WAP domain-containing protein n=1 Tax=Steinernema hermaphroditum TaxID=289476 RepID=A0AA39LEF7_9BILA|nr:hypothetical protein QR680_000534 [Steinernema hermaphroditum]
MFGKLVAVCLLASAVLGEERRGWRMCGNRLTALLIDSCTFRKEQWPCFKGYDSLVDGVVGLPNLRDAVGEECCYSATGCTIHSITDRCCFTLNCLQRCYPESGYQEIDGMFVSMPTEQENLDDE